MTSEGDVGTVKVMNGGEGSSSSSGRGSGSGSSSGRTSSSSSGSGSSRTSGTDITADAAAATTQQEEQQQYRDQEPSLIDVAASTASTASTAAASTNPQLTMSANGISTRSLNDVVRAPTAIAPDVVLVDEVPPEVLPKREVLDPKEDLWMSTYDGRYNSPLIPIVVGSFPDIPETFTVHKRILEKLEFFRKALSGSFRESENQAIHLPEDRPAIFHHVVVFLYEERYEPLKPLAAELIPDQDKGSGDPMDEDDSESVGGADSAAESILSDSTARSRHRRERRRRRDDRAYGRMRQKHPGMHRPNCSCPQCMLGGTTPCWHCSAPRFQPVPGPPPPHPPHPPYNQAPFGPRIISVGPEDRARGMERPRRVTAAVRRGVTAAGARQAGSASPGGRNTAVAAEVSGSNSNSNSNSSGGGGTTNGLNANGDRIKGEDMRTWLLAYELNIEVYICANKYLMEDFKRAVARACVDMLETAGSDAAQQTVLQLCRRLYEGLLESDPLLKMIFARVGFLQPVFMRNHPDETREFLVSNPEIAALVLEESMARREEDHLGGMAGGGGGVPGVFHNQQHHHHHQHPHAATPGVAVGGRYVTAASAAAAAAVLPSMERFRPPGGVMGGGGGNALGGVAGAGGGNPAAVAVAYNGGDVIFGPPGMAALGAAHRQGYIVNTAPRPYRY